MLGKDIEYKIEEKIKANEAYYNEYRLEEIAEVNKDLHCRMFDG